MKGYSDSYMQQLWRQAVKAHWGHTCARCGKFPVEIHHIVKRRRATLRNDWRNGIPLCHECHASIDTMTGRMWIMSVLPDWQKEHLMYMDKDIKQLLTEQGITRKEYDAKVVQQLKEKIKEVDL